MKLWDARSCNKTLRNEFDFFHIPLKRVYVGAR
jgi:hypothetical protein